MLLSHPNALCAGASEIYIWFKHIQKMWQFGPYNNNHATAGTFAFKRVLKDHKYNDNAALAEEKEFLKNYTVPFVQLEPKKTILVFSHIHNTFDKKKLVEQGQHKFQKECDKTVDEFIKEPNIKKFYMETIEQLLENYDPGHPKNKPDVLKQIKEIEEERKKMAQENANNQGKIILNQNGENIELNNQQIVEIMKKQQEQLQQLSKLLHSKDAKIESLQNEISKINSNNSNNSNDLRVINEKLDKLIRITENTI